MGRLISFLYRNRPVLKQEKSTYSRVTCSTNACAPRSAYRRGAGDDCDRHSIFAACRALGLKRVTAISPYTEAVDAAEHRFFAEGGIEAIAGAHLGIADGFRLAEPEAEAILDLAAGAWDPQSDGLIAACLNFGFHLVIDTLETRIGKPVVISTQAVLWHLLRLAGITTPIHGFGLLLREHWHVRRRRPGMAKNGPTAR
jgi:maleate isomerase